MAVTIISTSATASSTVATGLACKPSSLAQRAASSVRRRSEREKTFRRLHARTGTFHRQQRVPRNHPGSDEPHTRCLRCERLGSESGSRSGPCSGDENTVHDAERESVRIVEQKKERSEIRARRVLGEPGEDLYPEAVPRRVEASEELQPAAPLPWESKPRVRCGSRFTARDGEEGTALHIGRLIDAQ